MNYAEPWGDLKHSYKYELEDAQAIIMINAARKVRQILCNEEVSHYAPNEQFS